MRRVLAWVGLTVAGVGLLLSYPTSTSGPKTTHVATAIAPVGVVPAPAAAAAPSPAATVAPAATRSPKRSAPARRAAAPKTKVVARVAPKPAAPKPAAPRPSKAPAPAPTTRTINGAAVDTAYGPVQVQIKVRSGRIIASNAIVYPRDTSRDQEINDYAIPRLDDETLRAQSANIDTVSGASYTSEGYRQSLQSALDAAHL